MAKLLRGKAVSDMLTDKLIEEVKRLKEYGIAPALAIVRVGSHGDDIAYEKSAAKRCETIGVLAKKFTLSENISQEELLTHIHAINTDDSIHGVLLFRPLPKQLNDTVIRSALAPEKDVDGITDISMAGVYSDTDIGFPPCTPKACMEILDFYGIETAGRNIVIIGRSLVVGKPLAMMALKKNGTVTVCHTKTADLAGVARRADILIAAAGAAKTVGPEFVHENQIVIDVGINFTGDGTLCGDVDFERVEPLVKAITPVPGGVGTVTTGVLVSHVVEAAKKAAVKLEKNNG